MLALDIKVVYSKYEYTLLLSLGECDNYPSLPVIVTGEAETETPAPEPTADAEPTELPVADVIKSLVHFLANRPTHMPLWQYEDITAKGILIPFMSFSISDCILGIHCTNT